MARRAELAGAGALALAAVLWWALVPTYPAYDAYWHLVWGRELLDGVNPTFEVYAAPTEHPLYVLVAAIFGLVGEDADRLLVLAGLLSLVALVCGVWRLTKDLFGVWPAALAALFVGSSFAFLLYAVRAYVDVPFLALVAWAASYEVRERKWLPMVLLVFAGLLRPEAWVLAGLLWLWRFRGSATRERVILAGLVVLAPLLWFATDWVVTGDPLHSLTSTSELAEALGRDRGVLKAPRLFVVHLFDVARAPVALAGFIGAGLAVARYGWRAMAVPLALVVAGAVTFFGAGVAGLSLLPRYLTVPAVGLCVFAGYAVAGFTTLPPGDAWLTWWRRFAVAAAVVGIAFFAWKLPSFGKLSGELRFVNDTHEELFALLDEPDVRRARECGPITFPTYRLVPDARWVLDIGNDDVTTRAITTPDRGVAIFVARDEKKPRQRYGEADGVSRRTNREVPEGFVELGASGPFIAYGRC
ncbi:MAG: glycosyltransferase family 39 protein [Solirubrobacteraceae bacterium]|nr:glycosyltransferase family 39 protein [Solirubrobacteraceae bacterium]